MISCRVLFVSVALALAATSPGVAQTCVDEVHDFLAPYGIEHFSQHYIDALETLVCARGEYEAGNSVDAKAILDVLWAQYPKGSLAWGYLPSRPFGINIGSPPCYYALRMLSDMVDWSVAGSGPGEPPRTVRLTVLVIGESSGIEPQDMQDLLQGTGVPVVHTLDPRVEQNGYAVVHESLRLFEEYVRTAMTQAMLGVETHILPLPDMDLPVRAYVLAGGGYYAGLVDASQVWAEVPEADIEATDWWWILYPSHVPEQYPDFEDLAFITGGMGVGPDGISPYFIVDDRWLVRKPLHLGDGEYSSLERRAYLPQWLQHEFFHHVYRTYPEFGLEETPHQWFDVGTWPEDFEGRYEADYFHESLYRRLYFATPALHAGLRYATADAPWDQLTIDDVLGTYHREPVENPWHIGDIQYAGPQLQWRNTAGASWNLEDDLTNGALLTGTDCPYYGYPAGRQFSVVLERDTMGDLTTGIAGFGFMGELYRFQQGPLAAVVAGVGVELDDDVVTVTWHMSGAQILSAIEVLRSVDDGAETRVASWSGNEAFVDGEWKDGHLVQRGTYSYRLRAWIDGVVIESQPATVFIEGAPLRTRITGIAPNPFNPSTEIMLTLASSSELGEVSIYDTAGRLVRSFIVVNTGAARYSVRWNGQDQRGAPVASGVYLLRLSVNGVVENKRVVLLR